MHKYKVLIALLALLLVLSTYAAFSVPYQPKDIPLWDFPRLDTINMIEAYPWTVAIEKGQACVIDSFLGATDPGSVAKLAREGWTITSSQGGFHLCRFAINCRGVTPSSAGKYMVYHHRGPGFNLYPLNLTGFRAALNYIHRDSAGGSKTSWCYDIFKYIVIRLDWAVTPAVAAYFNPYMDYYANSWTTAEQILLAEGWTWDYGPDATAHTTDDAWVCPNGLVLWNGSRPDPKSDRIGDPTTGERGIYVSCPGDPVAPTSNELSKRFIKAWNWFFTGTESLTGVFVHDPQATSAPLTYIMYYNRDCDINFLCLSLGRFPTYLFSIFNSDMDVEGGSNDNGLVHPGINRLSRTFMYWSFKDYEILDQNLGEVASKTITACTNYALRGNPANVSKVILSDCRTTTAPVGVTEITLTLNVDYEIVGNNVHILQNITLHKGDSLEVIYDTCTFERVLSSAPADLADLWKAQALLQQKLFYVAVWVPVYSRDYIDSFKPGLTCWVESKGYGAGTQALIWTLCSIHRVGTEVGGTLNWHVSGDVVSLNLIAYRWVYEAQIINPILDSLLNINPYTHEDMPWIAIKWKIEPWNASLGVTGAKYTFWIRNDVLWQDGLPVTAYDIKWNWDYITKIKVAKWADLWKYYQKGEIIGDYIVAAYTNRTSFWDVYTYAGLALVFAPQIYSKLPTLTEATAFRPWAISYKAHTGIDPPADKPGLTCLFGTGPYWLQSWNEVDRAVLKKNENYFVRRATKLQQCNQMPAVTTCTSFAKYIAGTMNRTLETTPVTRTLETVERTLEVPYPLTWDATAGTYYHLPMDTIARTIWNNTAFALTSPIGSLWNESAPQSTNRWNITGWDDRDGSLNVTTFDKLTLTMTAGVGPVGKTWDFRVDTIFYGGVCQLVLMQVIPSNPIGTWWTSPLSNMTDWTDADGSGNLTIYDQVKLGTEWYHVKKVDAFPVIGAAKIFLTRKPPFQTTPTTSRWFEITPESRTTYDLNTWTDTDGSGNLTVSDQIRLNVTTLNVYYHVDAVNTPSNGPWNITVTQKVFGSPICTTWHEITPDYCTLWHIKAWTDTDGSGNLTVSDEVSIYGKLTGRTEVCHVDAVVNDALLGAVQINVTRKVTDIPRDPLYTLWHELAPNPCHDGMLTDWTDVDLSLSLTVGDEVEIFNMTTGTSGRHDVMEITIGAKVTIKVLEKVPGPMKIVKPILDIVIVNTNIKANCTFTWELWYCNTTKIANGSVTLPPLGTFTKKQTFPKPRDIPPCIHTWILKVITATGTNVYTIEMAYLVGDGNNDGTVNVKDWTLNKKYIGAQYIPPPAPQDPKWKSMTDAGHDYDLDDDGFILVKDRVILRGMIGRSCFC